MGDQSNAIGVELGAPGASGRQLADAGPLRVAVSLFTMTPRVMTGTATYARGLLGELARSHVPVEPIALVNQLMPEIVRAWTDEPLKVHALRSIPLKDTAASRLALLAQALTLPRTMTRQLPPAIDVFHYPLTLPLPRAGTPIVLTLHDVQHHDQPELFSSRQRAWRAQIYDRPARAATLVLTDSDHARHRIIDTLGIAPERIESIPLGIDHRRFHPAGDGDDLVLVGLELPTRFILYPAALWAHKNHRRLIDALSLLDDPEVNLVLTGPTLEGLGSLLEHAGARGVEDRVRHLGYVSSEQLAALYRRAEALVFPSLYEGFGAPPLEAMACGCPVATSGETSLDEVCQNAAISFDARSAESIASAMDVLLRDADLRARLRERGLDRARMFTWQAAAERHVAAYQRAVELAA